METMWCQVISSATMIVSMTIQLRLHRFNYLLSKVFVNKRISGDSIRALIFFVIDCCIRQEMKNRKIDREASVDSGDFTFHTILKTPAQTEQHVDDDDFSSTVFGHVLEFTFPA